MVLGMRAGGHGGSPCWSITLIGKRKQTFAFNITRDAPSHFCTTESVTRRSSSLVEAEAELEKAKNSQQDGRSHRGSSLAWEASGLRRAMPRAIGGPVGIS
jgi:hypothetical protein